MDSEIAFTIIGSVLGLVGIMFNIFPKQINKKLMGNLSEEASKVSAGFRIILGGVGITLAIVALSSRNFSPAEAKSLLYALGTGFVVIVTIFATIKLRGYGVFPLPHAIMFLILAAIAFYTGSGLTIE